MKKLILYCKTQQIWAVPNFSFQEKIQKWAFGARVFEKTNMSNIRWKSAECDEVLRLPRKNTGVGSPDRDFEEWKNRHYGAKTTFLDVEVVNKGTGSDGVPEW